MLYNEKYKEIYERKFNAYVLRSINGIYKNFLRELIKNRDECILNEMVGEDTELLDLIESKNYVEFEERIDPKNLENVMSKPRHYKAVKPLSLDEKIVVFLCIILDEETKNVAKMMGYASTTSVTRLLKQAKEKMRNNIDKMEENDNDRF